MIGVSVGNQFHEGSCGLDENSCAEYPSGFVPSCPSDNSPDSLSEIIAGGDRC